jgi:hypothetical protein
MRTLIGLHLAPPGETAALVVVRRGQRRRYYTEWDDQEAAERALWSPGRFVARRGQLRCVEGVYAVVHAVRQPGTAAQLADEVAALVERHRLAPVRCVADLTAVGHRGLDTFKERGLAVDGATVTTAELVAGAVARRALVQTCVRLLEEDRLRIAKQQALADALAAELREQDGPLWAALAVACWHGEVRGSYDPEAWVTVQA